MEALGSLKEGIFFGVRFTDRERRISGGFFDHLRSFPPALRAKAGSIFVSFLA